MVLALSVVSFACGDAQESSGTYVEVLTTSDGQTQYAQDFAIQLEVFQFGDDVGGIVRYFSTREAELNDVDPFNLDELVCFWTRRASAGERFTLRYLDDLAQTNSLALKSEDDGEALEGVKTLLRLRAPFRDEEVRDLSFDRVATEADNRCRRPVEEFDLRLVYDDQLQELIERERTRETLAPMAVDCAPGELPEPTTGECLPRDCGQVGQEECRGCLQTGESCAVTTDICSVLTTSCEPERAATVALGIVWVGLGTQTQDYTYNVSRIPPNESVNPQPTDEHITSLNLRPGRWSGEEIEYSDGVAMAVPVIYLDSDVDVVSFGGVTGSFDDDEDGDYLIGTSFEVFEEDGRDRARGLVLLYIDADPEDLDQDFTLAVTNPDRIRRGYDVYEIVYDLETAEVLSLTRSSSRTIPMRKRPYSEYGNRSADRLRELPRTGF